MHTFNKSFNAEQSGAHPKGIQVTHLAIVGSPGCYTLLLYVDLKV